MSGAGFFPRTRFHDHAAAAIGTPNEANRPNVHTMPNASIAPTGPQALRFAHGGAPGSGRSKVATLASASNANAPSSTAEI